MICVKDVPTLDGFRDGSLWQRFGGWILLLGSVDFLTVEFCLSDMHRVEGWLASQQGAKSLLAWDLTVVISTRRAEQHTQRKRESALP